MIINVKASLNNTIVNLCNRSGQIQAYASGGTVGFKKAQRCGFEPAYQATMKVLRKKHSFLQTPTIVRFKGYGPGRDASWKAICDLGWSVEKIQDCTPIPFGGCRPKKQRRV